jgi:predicted secreted protein
MGKAYSASDSRIVTSAGTTFDVELTATPTTGYQWEADASGDIVSLEKRDFTVRSDAIGASGVERFSFAAHRPGRATILFRLKRAWEPEPIETHTIDVEIR